jgi:trimethylamine--corrinoid protein Co-methyltransferase
MSKSLSRIQYLPEEALDQIEECSYRLLDEVGISLQHAMAAEMLQGRGCRVEKDRTFIPPHVVRWALDNVTPYTNFLRVDGSPGFHNTGGMPFIFDLDTGQRRAATLRDIADTTRVFDALPNLDVILPPFGPQDAPGELITLAANEAMIRNTCKPVISTAIEKPQDVPYVVEMAAACCGGMEAFRKRPTMAIPVSPVSPLTFTKDCAGSIIAVAESGAPFLSLPSPALGATSPITMAGALAQQQAEVLASCVIAATARPGCPVMYCSRITHVDLRTGASSWGGPEPGVTGACAVQLAHRLGLPCNSYGLATSSSQLDPQFAYERLLNTLVPALAGADILSGVGSVSNVLIGGLEIAVIDDEIIGLIKHVLAGCEVSEETLAFDVMKEVVGRDGVFLAERHTVKQMRKGAIWMSSLTEGVAEPSDAAGGRLLATARAKTILQTHQVEPLPEDTSRHLHVIMERARRALVRD